MLSKNTAWTEGKAIHFSIQKFIQDSDEEEKDKESGGLLIKRVKTQEEEVRHCNTISSWTYSI